MGVSRTAATSVDSRLRALAGGVQPVRAAPSADFCKKVRFEELVGVRPSDAAAESARHRRDKPRLHLSTGHALAIILLLVAGLGVCVSLIARQASNIAALSEQQSADVEQTQGSSKQETEESQENAQEQSQEKTEQAEEPQQESTSTLPAGVIDLNLATSEELQTVDGIGPVMAQRIIDYRAQIGKFTSVDQLLDVKGIGAKTLARIRDQVGVS